MNTESILLKIKGNLVMTITLGVIAALVVFAGGSIFLQNQKPKIELGLVDGKLKEIPDKKNAVSTETVYQDKLIKALPLKKTLEESKKAMVHALKTYPGIEIKNEQADYIYAVATTGTMKYHDDIEIFFDKKNNKIQYRSASRAGYSDMGLNRARYNKIVMEYEKL